MFGHVTAVLTVKQQLLQSLHHSPLHPHIFMRSHRRSPLMRLQCCLPAVSYPPSATISSVLKTSKLWNLVFKLTFHRCIFDIIYIKDDWTVASELEVYCSLMQTRLCEHVSGFVRLLLPLSVATGTWCTTAMPWTTELAWICFTPR